MDVEKWITAARGPASIGEAVAIRRQLAEGECRVVRRLLAAVKGFERIGVVSRHGNGGPIDG